MEATRPPTPDELSEARATDGEMDLTLRLIESGNAKLVVGDDGVTLKVRTDLKGPILGEVLKHRINARLTANGVGPKRVAVVTTAPTVVLEEPHQVLRPAPGERAPARPGL
jgi:hypothetical protein